MTGVEALRLIVVFGWEAGWMLCGRGRVHRYLEQVVDAVFYGWRTP